VSQPNIIWTGGPDELGSKCVIGLDRDGVINEDLGTYCYNPTDFKPIAGSLEAMADLRLRGYKLVIITDQGGIAKGLFTQAEVDAVHDYMMMLLGQAGCLTIDALYYSASSDKRDPFAKPNTGMFKKCEAEHKHIKFKEGYYVGDKIKDLKAALSMGSTPVLVRTGYGAETEAELNKYAYRELKRHTLVFDNLAAFAASLK